MPPLESQYIKGFFFLCLVFFYLSRFKPIRLHILFVCCGIKTLQGRFVRWITLNKIMLNVIFFNNKKTYFFNCMFWLVGWLVVTSVRNIEGFDSSHPNKPRISMAISHTGLSGNLREKMEINLKASCLKSTNSSTVVMFFGLKPNAVESHHGNYWEQSDVQRNHMVWRLSKALCVFVVAVCV